jgi:succinate-semialdehyde dehydrogenase/glutarate-semialdehyde dehydrogenase
MNEETFGPVTPLIRFSTEEEAGAMATDTPFGLVAYSCRDSYERAWRVSEALECDNRFLPAHRKVTLSGR